MLRRKSNVAKMAIYTRFDSNENDILDIAIVLMQGHKVVRCHYMGPIVDDSDDEAIDNILETETDDRMFKPTKVKFKIETTENDSEVIIPRIYDILQKYKEVLIKLDEDNRYDEEDMESEYVLYHDNTDSRSWFFDELYDYIEARDSTIIPTEFRTLYSLTTDIREIFGSYGYKQLSYVENSAVSNAGFVGLALDVSLGYA